MRAKIKIIHENIITKEVQSFLISKLGLSLPNYFDQLSLNSNPHIIIFYKQSRFIGFFWGERIEQVREVFELKLVIFEKNFVIHEDFWSEFIQSCVKQGISAQLPFILIFLETG